MTNPVRVDSAGEVATSRALRILHNPVTAWLVLAGGFLMTATAWHISSRSVRERAEERFVFQTDEMAAGIRERMIIYEQVLWGGVALFSANGFPDREAWQRYVQTLDIEEHWPGIQGIGVSVPVAPDGLDDLVRQMRATGLSDFRLSPRGPREEYSAIVYLEPLDWRNRRAIGYDMWSNEVRRAAMARARDTGEAATSGVITLVQETEEAPQPGFLTYLPVYSGGSTPSTVDERRRELVAWVYAPFRIGDLLDGMLGDGIKDVAFTLFDGVNEDGSRLFTSGAVPEGGFADQRLTRSIAIPLQGRQWTVSFASSASAMVGAEAAQPAIVAFGGLVIDVLLFYVISSLALVQRRANRLARRMTEDLRTASEELVNKNALLERQTATLERSNRELQEFAFAASHDLQEPLRAIGSFSELLTAKYGKVLDDDGRTWLNFVSDGARRMSALVEGILSYSRLNSAEMPFEPVDLDASLDRALGDLQFAIADQGVTITRDPLPTILGNEAQLAQLLQNLIANAIKYRDPDVSPQVSVRARVDGGEFLLEVEDNGIGIPQEHHDKIFQIFQRAHARSKYPGNGIGLSTCRKIVERHGGLIGVRSEPGIGSTFWVRLPLASVDRESSELDVTDGSTRSKRRGVGVVNDRGLTAL